MPTIPAAERTTPCQDTAQTMNNIGADFDIFKMPDELNRSETTNIVPQSIQLEGRVSQEVQGMSKVLSKDLVYTVGALTNPAVDSNPNPVGYRDPVNLVWDQETHSANVNAESWRALRREIYDAPLLSDTAPRTDFLESHLNGFNFNIGSPSCSQQSDLSYPITLGISEARVLSPVNSVSSRSNFNSAQATNDMGITKAVPITRDTSDQDSIPDALSPPFQQLDTQDSQDVQRTSKGRRKKFTCPCCYRMFDRIPRAKRCEDRHMGVKRFPCVGICGDSSWYAW